jgi:O-antigen/teichoic acid export membrane protein
MRVTRSIWTFASSQLLSAVTLTLALAATPMLLRWLGDERFGAVEAATDWIGYISLLEFGVGGALLPLLAGAVAHHDDAKVTALVAAGARAYLMLAVLMVVPAVLLVAGIVKVLPVGPHLSGDLRMGCVIGLLTIMLLPLAPLRILLEAAQRGYLVNLALLSQSILITLVSLLLAWAKWGIRGQFAAVLLGSLVFHTVVVARCGISISRVRTLMSRKLRESEEWKEIWNLNWPSFAFNICGRVGLLTDNILIGGLISPAMVVPFFLTQQLAVLARRQLQAIGNASWAALVELEVQGQRTIFNQRLIELTRLIAILAVAALVPIAIYDRDFITLWIGARRYGGDALVLVAAVNAFLLAIFSLWAWCINGTGQVRLIMPGLLWQTGINVVLSILLTLKLGIIGPVLGTTVGFLSVSAWYLPRLLTRLFDTKSHDLYKAAGWPMASAVPFTFAVWWMSRMFPVGGWIDMAAEMSIAALGYLIVWWLVGLSAGEKDLWLQRVNLLIPRDSY